MAAEGRVRGWCPGAWRPMASGDGLLVRVRPYQGRLSRAQALALCDAAETFGNGLIDLSSRANLQLRGVSEAGWPGLLDMLAEQGLLDPDPDSESRRNVLLVPDWRPGDDNDAAARLLLSRLGELPALPGKFGFAVDAGPAPVLGAASADLRIERAASSALLVRADGLALGTPAASVEAAVTLLLRLAHWFADSGGQVSGRMHRHRAPLPCWAPASMAPAAPRSPLPLGAHPLGRVYGLPFGRVDAPTLRAALEPQSVAGVRLTPWRRLLIEGPTGRRLPACWTITAIPGWRWMPVPAGPVASRRRWRRGTWLNA
ncbi:cobalamin biosynthesis protein CobG [Marinobacterium aestuariivivens]|uniref:Cobalamin biosynthesis protein CobG n=1 Tax=Marinobacterium aestuariivivens TaxID=1698799 RepID=A0ABW2A624_9GAMM